MAIELIAAFSELLKQPAAAGVVTAALTGLFTLFASLLTLRGTLRHARRRLEAEHRRWREERFRDETFRAVVAVVEAVADYDDALGRFQKLNTTQNKDLLDQADRALNRSAKVANVFFAIRESQLCPEQNPETRDALKELRNVQNDLCIWVTNEFDAGQRENFSSAVQRLRNRRIVFDQAVERLLASYS